MAITLVPMVCPQCGATLDVPVDKDECFCLHCGTKILVNNESVKTININKHITDEAKIEEARAGATIQEKKLEVVVPIAALIVVAIIFLFVLR